ncbi:MAG: hypothetical protein JWM95_3699 [Gemmatimonadetes bacterium]|nr:hypothetical protein [Gemmatimonadota bacterium]
MTLRRFCCLFAVTGMLAFAVGCERSKPANRAASVPPAVEEGTLPRHVVVPDSGWSDAAGPVLLIQGEGRDEALVIPPAEDDSGAATRLAVLGGQNSAVTLFGRGGEHLTGELEASPKTSDTQCRLWPLRAVHGAEGWAVGFIGGQTSAMALDSVERLSPRDSLALAAEVSRLASSVTTATAPSFQGLRFTAHDIRRFEVSPGVQAIVAHLIRRVNQEASPLEEQTLLIAERDSGVTTGPYQLRYVDRANGMEEEVPVPEVVGAVRIESRPTLIVARDSDTGVTYSMLERTRDHHWRIRWMSGPQRCE